MSRVCEVWDLGVQDSGFRASRFCGLVFRLRGFRVQKACFGFMV